MSKTTQVSIKEIKLAEFNPVIRTREDSLRSLMSQIQTAQRILVPVLIGNDNVLGDGHRRVACAKQLGWETVPAQIVKEFDGKTLWVILNAGTMHLTPSQWFAAVADGLPIDIGNMPPATRKRIEELIELLPDSMVRELIIAGRSPGILDTAKTVARYCGRNKDSAFLVKVIRWFMDTQSQFAARSAIKEDCPNDLLVEAIEENRSIRTVWEIE